jgi:peptidoglycan/LPS O-acetylase OafA/YrhL
MQDYKLNSVFWTLGLELQFYLLAPLLVYLVARRGDNPSIYISGLAWLLYCVAVDYPMRTGAFGWNYDARHIIGTLPHFLIGILGCQWSCKFKPNARVGLGALIVALILLVYSDILYHLVPGDYWSLKGSLIVDGTILMMIVAHVKLEEVILKGAAASGAIWILEWSGKLSYGVYAWHALLMHASATLASEFWLVLPLSFLAAYVTYLAVERPALTLKRWNDART